MQCNWYSRRKKSNISDGYSFSGPQPQLKAQLVPMYRSLPNAPTPHQVHTHTHTVRWYARCTTSTSESSKKRKRGASILNKSFQIAQYIIAKSARAGALILCASQDDSRCQNPSAVLRARALARVMHSRTNGTEQEELNQTTKNILPFKTLPIVHDERATMLPTCCTDTCQAQ